MLASQGRDAVLTTGRETQIVAAACLYMACRIKNSPHLLIDFSDAIQVDMFKIAKVFKIFSNEIKLKEHDITIIDPSLFIESFCGKLEFGEKLKQVKDTGKVATIGVCARVGVTKTLNPAEFIWH